MGCFILASCAKKLKLPVGSLNFSASLLYPFLMLFSSWPQSLPNLLFKALLLPLWSRDAWVSLRSPPARAGVTIFYPITSFKIRAQLQYPWGGEESDKARGPLMLPGVLCPHPPPTSNSRSISIHHHMAYFLGAGLRGQVLDLSMGPPSLGQVSPLHRTSEDTLGRTSYRLTHK